MWDARGTKWAVWWFRGALVATVAPTPADRPVGTGLQFLLRLCVGPTVPAGVTPEVGLRASPAPTLIMAGE